MLWVLITLTVIGSIAYGAITIISPKTAKGLKKEISALVPERKTRFAQFRYYDPKTGKQIDVRYFSVPGKVPEIQYLAENHPRRDRRLYSEDNQYRRKIEK